MDRRFPGRNAPSVEKPSKRIAPVPTSQRTSAVKFSSLSSQKTEFPPNVRGSKTNDVKLTRLPASLLSFVHPNDAPDGEVEGDETEGITEDPVEPEIPAFIPRRRGRKVDPSAGLSAAQMEAHIRIVEDEFVKVIRRRWTPLEDKSAEEEMDVPLVKRARHVETEAKRGLDLVRYLISLFIVAPAIAIAIQGELGMRLFSGDEERRAAWQGGVDLFDLFYTSIYVTEYLLVLGFFLYFRYYNPTVDEDSVYYRMWGRVSILESVVVLCSVFFSAFHYLDVPVPKLYDRPNFPLTWAIYSLRVKILRLVRLPRFVFEKSYDKLMHAIVKPMITYFFPLLVLLLFIITICSLIGHFLFGFYASSEEQNAEKIDDWQTFDAAFMSILDFFLGDQWGDVYEKQYNRNGDDVRSRRVLIALFVVMTVVGLGIIYAAVFIAVLIFKVGEQNEEEAELNEKELERLKIQKRLDEYEESQRHLLHLLETGRLKPLSDLLEQQMYRSFRRLDLISKERPRTTRLWMEGLVTSLNWLTAAHKHLLAVYQYMEASMDEMDKAAVRMRELARQWAAAGGTGQPPFDERQ